jgi:hypothetical protein
MLQLTSRAGETKAVRQATDAIRGFRDSTIRGLKDQRFNDWGFEDQGFEDQGFEDQ